MALSGVYDSAWTVSSVVIAAFKKAKIGIAGETLSAVELADGISALQLMLRTWAARGIRIHLLQTQSVTFVAGTATYTLGIRALDVAQAYTRADDQDEPVQIVTREEYERLPDKTAAGRPFTAYSERTRTATTVTVYPVPTATEVASAMTLRLVTKRMIQDVTAGTEDLDFPSEWIEAVVYNLAVRLSPDYGVNIDPRVEKMATMLFDDLEGQDREGSVKMRPSPRR
jgi:hypothetical protein